eukprot:scaffold4825_cov132-Cylindrotheca_fusiformis.AAC.3
MAPNQPVDVEFGQDIVNGNGYEETDLMLRKYEDEDDSSVSSINTIALRKHNWNRSAIVTTAVVVFGLLAAGLFAGFGISAANRAQDRRFALVARELSAEFQLAWNDYETASLWLYQACENQPINRSDFRDIYAYLTVNLAVRSITWCPRVLPAGREQLESQAREFFNESTFFNESITYNGIIGYEPDPTTEIGASVQYRSEHDFYYPAHFTEPLDVNLIDFDLYSVPSMRDEIDRALRTHQTTATRPFWAPEIPTTGPSDKLLMLINPGIPLPSRPNAEPSDLAILSFRVKELVRRATAVLPEAMRAIFYFSTDEDPEPTFAIAADLKPRNGENNKTRVSFLDESGGPDADSALTQEFTVQTSTIQWTIIVQATDETFKPNVVPSIVGSIFIVVASCFMALWIFTDMKRTRAMNDMKQKNDAEKAAMVLASAQEAAEMEQELNDYIAHEVRNPLSAAMSALTFVKSAMIGGKTLKVKDVEEDVGIIDSSLRFMNDLLRSMLDFHRAKSGKIKIVKEPMDVSRDLLQAVAAMLYASDSDIKIVTDCPEGLIIETDPLRMKQIVLNLGRSSTKVVTKGYIKLSAKVENGFVKVIVEDSGPGIPIAMRKHLFSKFQESLEDLNQGTGIGLCLCKNMIDLLDGDIYLDETFNSGVDGLPGARFVVDTKTAPMTREDIEAYINTREEISSSLRFMLEKELSLAEERAQDKVLPETYSVLFVDDDLILRKLFTRSVKKIAKTWTVKDAPSGETAIEMVEKQDFDLIFIDQYMASVEKQLLGTETTRALRAKGVSSRICGLSANDVEIGFFKAGADFFMLKPLPCQADELRQELLRMIYSERNLALEDTLYDLQNGQAVAC